MIRYLTPGHSDTLISPDQRGPERPGSDRRKYSEPSATLGIDRLIEPESAGKCRGRAALAYLVSR